MERLSKQNKVPEEQLQQKNTAMVSKRRIKKVPVLNEETKRGRKEVMPQANQKDRTWVVHQPLIRLHPSLLQRCKWWENEWTLWWTRSRGKCLAISTIWSPNRFTIHHVRQLFPLSTKVSYAVGGKLRRKQRPAGSLGVLQDPHAPSGDTRRDHVQGLPYHIEGPCKGLVQQANAQLH